MWSRFVVGRVFGLLDTEYGTTILRNVRATHTTTRRHIPEVYTPVKTSNLPTTINFSVSYKNIIDQLGDYQLSGKDIPRSKLLGDQNMPFCEFRKRKTTNNDGHGSDRRQMKGTYYVVWL